MADADPKLPLNGEREASPAVARAACVVACGLAFLYVKSFVLFMVAQPFLPLETSRHIEKLYEPLIWLCLRGETIQRWIVEA